MVHQTTAGGSRAVVLLTCLLLLTSCATLVYPPHDPQDPQTVILLTHGRSSSLLLPDGDGVASRWAFGDWRYYAEGDKGVSASLAAVLWSTPSALGRQDIAGFVPVRELVPQLGIGVDRVYQIVVGREQVIALQARLEELFARAPADRLYNPGPRLEFAPHPEPYTLRNNSNRKVAEWLTDLGCRIRGAPMLSRWRVEEPSRGD